MKVFTGGFSILYFLFVLIQLKLITSWLVKRVTSASWTWKTDILLFVTPLFLLLLNAVRLYTGSEKGVGLLSHFFPAWFIYYYIGLICKFRNVTPRPSYMVLSLLVTLVISTLVAFSILEVSPNVKITYTQAKLTSMAYALCLILLLYSIRDVNIPRNILCRFGEMSFGIYILHMVVKELGAVFISIMNIDVTPILSIPILKYISVLLVTVVILNISQRLIPTKFLRIIGFE